ncbi:hypothetical protein PV396_11755 [Streptomyces sp. ME02-8801-2C]|uniref:hypothetical protein n=1 Tax=Streptomyces sp. ME02-8801-2C TaxID=3028680 RepID=UPI0029A41693|nr:hypothetical protein [Streptomyces sp. ME02-8801-2C]MDX3452612.1 hypothetical protein [Streptomyces sp. ME02-8801-2C]
MRNDFPQHSKRVFWMLNHAWVGRLDPLLAGRRLPCGGSGGGRLFRRGERTLVHLALRALVEAAACVDPAECARRAGQGIEVLFRHYATFRDGVREQANRLIEESMQEWDRVSQSAESEG